MHFGGKGHLGLAEERGGLLQHLPGALPPSHLELHRQGQFAPVLLAIQPFLGRDAAGVVQWGIMSPK